MLAKLFAVVVLGLWVIAGPVTADTITVTTLEETPPPNDPPHVTFRQALRQANASVGPDTIFFDGKLAGGVLKLMSSLPDLTGGAVTIVGDMNVDGVADITIDGSRVGDGSGLLVTSSNNWIIGLSMRNFVDGACIEITSAFGNQIQSCGLGTGSRHGLVLTDAPANLVGPWNIISAASECGLRLRGALTVGNDVQSNWIGTTGDGTQAAGNGQFGVLVHELATMNTIGPGNTISGNGINGVLISDPGTQLNEVVSNHIGTDSSGDSPIGNGIDGVFIGGGASDNTIGPHNLISGNGMSGIVVAGDETMGNIIRENRVGTDVDGSSALPNNWEGVVVCCGAHHNIVGPDNVLSGNVRNGLAIGADAAFNEVHGNRMGTNPSGDAAIANQFSGIALYSGALANLIGPDNQLSGNVGSGIWIGQVQTESNAVVDNLIGCRADGATPLPNMSFGVHLTEGATDNMIGPGNVIGGNTLDGVFISMTDTVANEVEGNVIGVGPGAAGGAANGGSGVLVLGGASLNRIGPDNVISGNAQAGVVLAQAGTTRNVIGENTIGLDAVGQGIGNMGSGIAVVDGASNNFIGVDGPNLAAQCLPNIVRGNGDDGVFVGSDTSRTFIRCNDIRDNGSLPIRVLATSAPHIRPWSTIPPEGRCLAPDGSIVDVYSPGGAYLSTASLMHRRFVLNNDPGSGAIYTITTAEGTSELGCQPPRLFLAYRNSATFDVIAGHYDHVGMLFDFEPYGETEQTAVLVESTPFLFGGCGGPCASTWAEFRALAAGTDPSNLPTILMPGIASTAFDWIWHNPAYDTFTVLGETDYWLQPFYEKGDSPDACPFADEGFSCVGFVERVVEESGRDVTPGARCPLPSWEHFGWPALLNGIFYPTVQFNFLAPGLTVTPVTVANFDLPLVARTSGQSLPYLGTSMVPFDEAVTRLTVLQETGGFPAGLTTIQLSDTVPGVLGVAATIISDEGALEHVPADYDANIPAWTVIVPRIQVGALVAIEVFAEESFGTTPLTIMYAGGDAIAAEVIFDLELAYAPISNPVLPGDLDLDGLVGITDLIMLLAAWGQTYSELDLNQDYYIGTEDLLVLLGAWGHTMLP